jgi:outer membrane cobalamin receptor
MNAPPVALMCDLLNALCIVAALWHASPARVLAQAEEPVTAPPTVSLSAAPPDAPAQSPDAPDTAIEVEVRTISRAEKTRQSALAVNVLELREAHERTADLGEVLARETGVGVRRAGGLGSDAQLSLNGLTNDQIRFLLDGVPLELSGYKFGLANAPVSLFERLEIYRGVVPARFGVDALGGAINLLSDDSTRGTHGTVSYQTGAFGTHRLSLVAHDHRPGTGFFSKAEVFADSGRNDYLIDVETIDRDNRPQPARVHRFHDGYRATGGVVTVGFVRRSWAERLLLRVFAVDYDKDLQHDLLMTAPYGAITYGNFTSGASLRYDQHVTYALRLQAMGGYTFAGSRFTDTSTCIYDWYGRCFASRQVGGETSSQPHDQRFQSHAVFARTSLEYRPHEQHVLRVSAAPTFVTRTGQERELPSSATRDPLSAERKLLTAVGGLEHEWTLLAERLQNIAFVKGYLQQVQTEEVQPPAIFRGVNRVSTDWGVGDAVRYRLNDWFYMKASYERALRLPRVDEVFGDTVLVGQNLRLSPERSHNGNLSVMLDASQTPLGALRAEVNGFLRKADRLIALLPQGRSYAYQNVARARALGLEASAGWTSPREYVAVDGNVTYQGFRNRSPDDMFEGDRLPNRPYLFANGSARLQLRERLVAQDRTSLSWNTRYVHSFYRSWESAGLRSSKDEIPMQVVHALALTYEVRSSDATSRAATFSIEVQNLTDTKAFDYFGVQRPGRAVYCRATVDL